jgi:hypothetical protein
MMTGVLKERMSRDKVNVSDVINDILLTFEDFETSWSCCDKIVEQLYDEYKLQGAKKTKDEAKTVWNRVHQYELDDVVYQHKLSDISIARDTDGGRRAIVPARQMYGQVDVNNPFVVPRMTTSQRSLTHAVGTGQSLSDYYADVLVADDFLVEAIATPVEIAETWDRVFSEMSISDERTMKFVRAQVLVYAVHNGTSDKLAPRSVWRFGGKDYAMADIIRIMNEPAGTFRRTLRGMAHEARYLLSKNPQIMPAWGRSHGMDVRREDLRVIGFDFADALSDLTYDQRRILERAKSRALVEEDKRRRVDESDISRERR